MAGLREPQAESLFPRSPLEPCSGGTTPPTSCRIMLWGQMVEHRTGDGSGGIERERENTSIII